MEHNKEATEKVFRRSKGRSKVPMTHFKVKMTGASYVIVYNGYE